MLQFFNEPYEQFIVRSLTLQLEPFFYFEPPNINDFDHKELAEVINSKLADRKWVVSYENQMDLSDLYPTATCQKFNNKWIISNNNTRPLSLLRIH